MRLFVYRMTCTSNVLSHWLPWRDNCTLDSVPKCLWSAKAAAQKCWRNKWRLIHHSAARRNEVLINLWYFFRTQPISLSQIEMLQVIINVWCTIPRRLSLRLNQFHQSSSQLVIFFIPFVRLKALFFNWRSINEQKLSSSANCKKVCRKLYANPSKWKWRATRWTEDGDQFVSSRTISDFLIARKQNWINEWIRWVSEAEKN